MDLNQTNADLLALFTREFEMSYDEEQLNILLKEKQFNSVDYVRFIVAIENELGIEFSDDMLGIDAFQSLDAIEEYINSLMY